MALIGPGILCVFGLAFLWVWVIEKKRHYLLLLAAAPPLFALGVVIHAFFWPNNAGQNALLVGLLYTLAVLLAAEAIVRRSGKRLGLALDGAILAAIMGAMWYFAYVSPNLLMRIYIQNFGYGLVFLLAAFHLTPLMRGKRIDRILFWVLLAFALQFFIRTSMTVGPDVPTSLTAFFDSVFWHALHLSLAVLGAGLATAVLMAALSDAIDDLRQERDIDGLTGVLNRRAFEDRASVIVMDATQAPCALIACDLDYFKEINDRFGHAVGDDILRAFGDLLRATVRASDPVGRIGGEEFAILMRGATLSDAYRVAEQLRVDWSKTEFASRPADFRVTASFGVAEAKPDDGLFELLEHADKRLYQAKAMGRNQTVSGDDASIPTSAPHRARRAANSR